LGVKRIAPLSNSEGRTFQVTHPFHPLAGQTFDLVAVRHNWGNDQVYFQDAAGHLRTLPSAWTSLSPADPVILVGAGRSPFKLADLLELSRLLQALRQPLPPSSSRPDGVSHRPEV
jgi:hypothetical protein